MDFEVVFCWFFSHLLRSSLTARGSKLFFVFFFLLLVKSQNHISPSQCCVVFLNNNTNRQRKVISKRESEAFGRGKIYRVSVHIRKAEQRKRNEGKEEREKREEAK